MIAACVTLTDTPYKAGLCLSGADVLKEQRDTYCVCFESGAASD